MSDIGGQGSLVGVGGFRTWRRRGGCRFRGLPEEGALLEDSEFKGGWKYLDAGVVDEDGPARREHLRQALVVQRRPERARDAFEDGRHAAAAVAVPVAGSTDGLVSL